MQRILTRTVSESTSRSGFNREVCTGNGTTLSVVEFVVKDIDSRPEFYKESLFPQCYPTVAALTGKNGFRGSGRKNHAVLIGGNSVKIKFRDLQCYPIFPRVSSFVPLVYPSSIFKVILDRGNIARTGTNGNIHNTENIT